MTRLQSFESDGYELDDGEQLHSEHPATFEIPDAERRRNLRPGDLVKLVFRMEEHEGDELSVERMWVEFVEARDGFLIGRLDNEPFGDVVVKCDDRVVFEPRHVIAVWED